MKTKTSMLTIRIPHELKHKIEQMAYAQGISINQLALYTFTKEIIELENANYFAKFYNNKSKKDIFSGFDLVMKKIQSREIPDWDKISS